MYCGTCKSDPCFIDDGQMCCHDLGRWGYCPGHAPVREKQMKAFEAFMEPRLREQQRPIEEAAARLDDVWRFGEGLKK